MTGLNQNARINNANSPDTVPRHGSSVIRPSGEKIPRCGKELGAADTALNFCHLVPVNVQMPKAVRKQLMHSGGDVADSLGCPPSPQGVSLSGKGGHLRAGKQDDDQVRSGWNPQEARPELPLRVRGAHTFDAPGLKTGWRERPTAAALLAV